MQIANSTIVIKQIIRFCHKANLTNIRFRKKNGKVAPIIFWKYDHSIENELLNAYESLEIHKP